MPAGEEPSCILRYLGVLYEFIPALIYEKPTVLWGWSVFCTMITRNMKYANNYVQNKVMEGIHSHKRSDIRAIRQTVAAVKNRFFVRHATTIPATMAMIPESRYPVCVRMTGKVMTDRVM